MANDDPLLAQCLNNLGELYLATGDYGSAENFVRESLEIRKRSLGEDHLAYSISLTTLAKLLELGGDLAGARPLYVQVVEIRRIALQEGHIQYAGTLENLRALYAEALNNLGVLYRGTGHNDEAEELFRQAIEAWRGAGGEANADRAAGLSNLAGLYKDTSRYEEAERSYREAYELWRNELGEAHPWVAACANNLAEVYRESGQLESAEPLYEKAVSIWESTFGKDHPDLAKLKNNLALLFAAQGNSARALSFAEKAARTDDKLVGAIFSTRSERQRMALLELIKGRAYSFLSIATLDPIRSPMVVRSAFDLVLRRKGIGAEALAAQRDAVLADRYPHLRNDLSRLAAIRSEIARRTLDGPGPEGLPEHKRLLAERQAYREEVEANLARQIPQMNLETRLREADRNAIARMLPAGSALVEFVRFNVFDFKAVPARGEARWKPARYLAFLLIAGEPDSAQLIELGEAHEIDRMVGDFRDAIISRKRGFRRWVRWLIGRRESEYGSDLRAAVFDSVLARLSGARRFFIAPDGDLSRLPFEVLPLQGGRRVIDEYQITYLSTGRDLLRHGDIPSGKARTSLIVADPDFDLVDDQEIGGESVPPAERQSRSLRSRRLRFGRLPGTRVEGERIGQMLGSDPLLAEEALEGRLKTCRSPWILHIATHGFFLADQKPDLEQVEAVAGNLASGDGVGQRRLTYGMENPMLRSGLALAGANTWLMGRTLPQEAEDAILNGEDASGLDLLDTEMVVLSACETGLGEVEVGEGVYGLRRAFVLAGARTLVMSLWKVPDRETQELMEDFYRRILEGEARGEALRQAQLAMKEKNSEPLYWGAFICQGEEGPLVMSKESRAATTQ